jgi:hypothetical protein
VLGLLICDTADVVLLSGANVRVQISLDREGILSDLLDLAVDSGANVLLDLFELLFGGP